MLAYKQANVRINIRIEYTVSFTSIVCPNEPDLQNSVLGLLPQKRLWVNCINLLPKEKKKKKAALQNSI